MGIWGGGISGPSMGLRAWRGWGSTFLCSLSALRTSHSLALRSRCSSIASSLCLAASALLSEISLILCSLNSLSSMSSMSSFCFRFIASSCFFRCSSKFCSACDAVVVSRLALLVAPLPRMCLLNPGSLDTASHSLLALPTFSLRLTSLCLKRISMISSASPCCMKDSSGRYTSSSGSIPSLDSASRDLGDVILNGP